MLQYDAAFADVLDQFQIVADDHQRLTGSAQFLHLGDALALEGLVADRQHLVHQEQIGVGVHGDRERQPHVHAGGVELDLGVDELLDAAEGDDGIETLVHLLLAQAEDGPVQVDVLTTGEVRMHAGAHLDQPGDPAADTDTAAIREHHTADQFESGRLSGAVEAKQRDRLALGDRERDVVEGVEVVAQLAASSGRPPDDVLLDGAGVAKVELLHHVGQFGHHQTIRGSGHHSSCANLPSRRWKITCPSTNDSTATNRPNTQTVAMLSGSRSAGP